VDRKVKFNNNLINANEIIMNDENCKEKEGNEKKEELIEKYGEDLATCPSERFTIRSEENTNFAIPDNLRRYVNFYLENAMCILRQNVEKKLYKSC